MYRLFLILFVLAVFTVIVSAIISRVSIEISSNIVTALKAYETWMRITTGAFFSALVLGLLFWMTGSKLATSSRRRH